VKFVVKTLLFLEIVVVHLDAKDDAAACCRHQIGQKQCPQHIRLVHKPLYHKSEATNSHHQEGGKGNTVSIMPMQATHPQISKISPCSISYYLRKLCVYYLFFSLHSVVQS